MERGIARYRPRIQSDLMSSSLTTELSWRSRRGELHSKRVRGSGYNPPPSLVRVGKRRFTIAPLVNGDRVHLSKLRRIVMFAALTLSAAPTRHAAQLSLMPWPSQLEQLPNSLKLHGTLRVESTG